MGSTKKAKKAAKSNNKKMKEIINREETKAIEFVSDDSSSDDKTSFAVKRKRQHEVDDNENYNNEDEMKRQKVPMAPGTSFRDLNLPVSPFTTPCAHVPEDSDENPTILLQPKLPKSTPEGRQWLPLVVKTSEHPSFSKIFNFSNGKDDEWITAKPYGSWCASNPHAIAIDCEMCKTRDPTSGWINHSALCRISVVNAVDPDEVLLDSLVKPPGIVLDYRSEINGIRRADLNNVSFTLEHAQMFMQSLCSDETVIIGHAVENDLKTLKMDHCCVVDSSLLFGVKGAPPGTKPSLKDLSTQLKVTEDMPEIHDSVNDARMALRCCEWYRDHENADSFEVESSSKKFKEDVLVLHRLPPHYTVKNVQWLFETYTSVLPKEVEPIKIVHVQKAMGVCNVQFASLKHAELAFDCFTGSVHNDRGGRAQKKVRTTAKDGTHDYFYVRKNMIDTDS